MLLRDDDVQYKDEAPYDDPGIAHVTEWVGLSSGANPSSMTVASANGQMWVEDEDIGIEALKKEEAQNWWEFFESPPFWPIRISPFFNVRQGDKVRRVHHLSKDPKGNGQSVNGQLSPYLQAKLDLVRRDQIGAAIVDLVKKLDLMVNGWGWRGVEFEIVMGWTDLKSAYNQTNIDERDLWYNCASYVTKPGKGEGDPRLLIGAGLKSAFGGGDTVRSFSRLTRLSNWAVHRALSRAGEDFPLQEQFRRELERRGSKLPEGYRPIPDLHLQTTGTKPVFEERVAAEENARLGPQETCLLAQWRGINPDAGVTAAELDRRPGPSIQMSRPDELFSCCTYLDDTITLMIQVKQGGTGKAGGDGTDPVGSAEWLRLEKVGKTIEKAGFEVVNDARSQKKWGQGKMATIQTALGCEYDFTEPLNPKIGTKEEKRLKALLFVDELLRNESGSPLDFKTVESAAGVLGDISQIVLRGSTYTCGIYAAMKGRRESGTVPFTAWMRRNLRWWRQYLESGAPKQRLLVPPPALEKKFCPHSDASTSWGYGGFWIEGSTCYYIQGQWTPKEKELIDRFEMEINFLEAATCGFLMQVADGRFEGTNFRFYCDNMCSVRVLTSYKTRTYGLARQLERMDLMLSKHGLKVDFVWIATDENKESDALSRNALDEFLELIKTRYGVFDFVHVQVPDNVRDLSDCIETFEQHPEWCVGERRSKAQGRACDADDEVRS